MSIHSCAPETLLAIFKELDRASLVSVTATCRSARQLSETLLYSTIRFRWTRRSQPRIILLLRTFLERPELGRYLRDLTLVGKDNLHLTEWRMGPELLHYFVCPPDSLLDAVRALGMPQDEADNWVKSVEWGCSDAVVGLIVSMAPNLVNLSLSENWAFVTRRLGRVFKLALRESVEGGPVEPVDPAAPAAPRRQQAFHSLARVCLTPWLNDLVTIHTPWDADRDILALFYLPSIKELTISVPTFRCFEWPFAKPPAAARLTSMKLLRIRERHLAPILAAAHNLKSLEYEWLYHEALDSHASKPVAELDHLGEALGDHGHSLVDLTITARALYCPVRSGFERPPIAVKGLLAGLSQLPNLEVLQIPWLFVKEDDPKVRPAIPNRLLCDVLPGALERLTLTDELGHSDMFTTDDLTVCHDIEDELKCGLLSSATSLRGIRLPHRRYRIDPSDECLEQIEILSKEYGIELTQLARAPQWIGEIPIPCTCTTG
ncbi:hypothetical protein ACHAQA_007647 [Verticillium albo-atrum]